MDDFVHTMEMPPIVVLILEISGEAPQLSWTPLSEKKSYLELSFITIAQWNVLHNMVKWAIVWTRAVAQRSRELIHLKKGRIKKIVPEN